MQEEDSGEPRASQPVAELAEAIGEALAAGDRERIGSLIAGLQAPDLADLIELLEPGQRLELVESLGSAFDPEALSELAESVRDQLLRDLPPVDQTLLTPYVTLLKVILSEVTR